MSLRRVLALALLVPITGPAVLNLAVVHGRADVHSCAEGTCRCPHGRPSKPAEPAPCHDGERRPEADCRMSARCNHEAPAVSGTAPCTPASETRPVAVDHTRAPGPTTLASTVLPGFSRIDSPPPRHA
jgi:hypothetical protein